MSRKPALPLDLPRLAKQPGLLQRCAKELPAVVTAPSTGVGDRAFTEPRFGHEFKRINIGDKRSGRIQTKLKISTPGDRDEREADEIADQVLGRPVPDAKVQSARPASSALHRLTADQSPSLDDIEVGSEDDSQQPLGVQRLARSQDPGDAARSDAEWENRLASSGQAGQPLAPDLHQYMANRFQMNFASVRIHRDSEAARLSAEISARAFTHGAHVYFGVGEYAPDTEAGRKVLAHELVHVMQQGAARPGLGVSTDAALGPSASARTSIRRMARLNSTSPSNFDRADVRPWGGSAPSGNNYRVQTDAGTDVTAWVAYGGNPDNLSYWCHGLSLGTYAWDGYSVYSGGPMQQVIADEWTPVAPAAARAGDIAVFLPNYDHSARFTSVVTSGNSLDENASRLNTKNGQAALKNDSMVGIKAVYPNRSYQCYRHV